MSIAHEVRGYDYVNRPYERVSEALRLDAIGVFQRATASATARARALVSTMRANVGPLELGVVGAVFDAVIGRRVADAAVHRFVEEIAERLRVDVTASL